MAGYAGASSVSNPEGDLGTETSPDLLKNTPSNISRLEDVIEHCKGRRKYLARTSSPSDGEDVRWYFCKVPLAVKELAASIPRTEIVGKGDYFRFSMRDSLALEASFLQREEELLSYWWKEYAECSEGPRSSGVSSKSSSAFEDDSDGDLYAIDEERVGVPVKGGLYEVDLKKRHSFPVYWSGENRRVLRGHWFARKGNLDWLPVREDIAEQLELAYRCQVWHRRTFQPSGLFAARVDLQGIIQGLHALFTGEDDTWEAWLGTDHSGLSLNKGGGNGFKLRRGFAPSGFLRPTQDELRQQKEEEMDDYCSQVPVGHLVFMVHGIGQRLEKANLVDDVGNFRQITACLAERHLSPYQRSTQRVLFIPCQWRRGLRLSSESAVEKITLDGVRGLRETLGATVHDVLYYMSPIYCQDIIDSVSNQLNKLYQKFLKRNPGYNGKVSLYAHSLGSVLSYDILCHQESLTSPFPMEKWCNQVPEEPRSLTDTNTKIILGSETEKAKGPSAEIESRIPLEVETSLPYQDNTLQHDVNALCPAAPILMSAAEGGFPNAGDISSSGYLNEAEENHYEPLDTSLFNANLKSGLQSEQSNMETKLNQKYENFDGRTCSGPEGSSGNTLSKEETIKLLREELDILKIRINQLEQGSNIHGSNENTTNGNHKLVHGREEDCPMTSLFSQNKHPMGKGDQRKNYTPLIRYTKLGFKVDTFFAVGSPLGVFLALRNIRMGIGRGQEYWQDERITEEMPSCRQMFNIFHPFDPVAYRIEPLVCKEYISKRPVIIPYHRGGKRLHIGFQDFTEDLAARSHAVIGHLSTIKTKMVNMFRSGQTSNLEDSTESLQSEERSYGSLMMERLSSSENGRIDHMLQDKTFEHSYISALSSHTNYWRDFDTALFILKHLYRDIPEERSFDEELEGEGSKKVSGWEIELFFQNQALDEDTPLTFYGKFAVREFARRARKAMQSKKQ